MQTAVQLLLVIVISHIQRIIGQPTENVRTVYCSINGSSTFFRKQNENHFTLSNIGGESVRHFHVKSHNTLITVGKNKGTIENGVGRLVNTPSARFQQFYYVISNISGNTKPIQRISRLRL